MTVVNKSRDWLKMFKTLLFKAFDKALMRFSWQVLSWQFLVADLEGTVISHEPRKKVCLLFPEIAGKLMLFHSPLDIPGNWNWNFWSSVAGKWFFDLDTKVNLVSTCNWNSSADICNHHNGQPKQQKFHGSNKSTCRFKIANNVLMVIINQQSVLHVEVNSFG